MSEGTISETPLFRPAFSTSSPFCRIPTRRETRKIQHPRELFSPYAFAPYHFIQQRRERFVSTPRPHQPFKPSSSVRGKNPSWEKSSFSGLFSILYFSFFLSFSTRNSKFHRYPVKLLGGEGEKKIPLQGRITSGFLNHPTGFVGSEKIIVKIVSLRCLEAELKDLQNDRL